MQKVNQSFIKSLPELPEVETVRRGLEQKLKNFIIEDIEILRSSTIAFPKNNVDFIEGVNNSKVGKWKGWMPARETFEDELLNDFC